MRYTFTPLIIHHNDSEWINPNIDQYLTYDTEHDMPNGENFAYKDLSRAFCEKINKDLFHIIFHCDSRFPVDGLDPEMTPEEEDASRKGWKKMIKTYSVIWGGETPKVEWCSPDISIEKYTDEKGRVSYAYSS